MAHYDVVKINPAEAPADAPPPSPSEPDAPNTGSGRSKLFTYGIVGGALAVVFACFMGLRVAGKAAATDLTPTPTPISFAVSPTFTLPPPIETPTITPTFTPTMTPTPENYQLFQTGLISDSNTVTMIGFFIPKSGCGLTNFGFAANEHEFYLAFENLNRLPWLGLADPRGLLTVVQGYTETVNGCDDPFLHVETVSWFNERATEDEIITYVTATAETVSYRAPVNTPTPTFTPTVWNTPTPYPTYTQPPPTPYPTYTPRPQQPTFTPYPTYTPRPTNTPTVTPTFTPYPTYTPYPTFTPAITGTLTPAVTPSATPAPTLTATPTPTSTGTIQLPEPTPEPL